MSFTIKTTFSFAGLEQGWSETFYWLADTDNLDLAETLVTPLYQARAALLARDYYLTIGRNSVVLDNAGAKVKRVTDLFEPRIVGNQTWASADPNIALMLVWQTADNKYSKKQYLRGIPAGVASNGKIPALGYSTFNTPFQSWRAKMAAFKAGWLRGVTSTVSPITSFTVDALTARVSFTLNPGFTPWPVAFNKPTLVHVQVPGKSPLDGPLIVVPTDATHCYTPQSHPTPIPGAGQFGDMSIRTPVLSTLAPLNGQGLPGIIHPQRIVTHKTGRPSYASRGRVAPKVRW